MANIGARGRYLTQTVTVNQAGSPADAVHTVGGSKRWLISFIRIKVTTSGSGNLNTVKLYTDDAGKAATSKIWPDETNVPDSEYGIDLLRFYARPLEVETEIRLELTNSNGGGAGNLTLTVEVFVIEGAE